MTFIGTVGFTIVCIVFILLLILGPLYGTGVLPIKQTSTQTTRPSPKPLPSTNDGTNPTSGPEFIDETIKDNVDRFIDPEIIKKIEENPISIDPQDNSLILGIYSTAISIEIIALLLKNPKFYKVVSTVISTIGSLISALVARLVATKVAKEVAGEVSGEVAAKVVQRSLLSKLAAKIITIIGQKNATMAASAASVVGAGYAAYSAANLALDIADMSGEGRYYFSLLSNELMDSIKNEIDTEVANAYIEAGIEGPIMMGPLNDYSENDMIVAMTHITGILLLNKGKYFEPLINEIKKLDQSITNQELEEFLMRPENINYIDIYGLMDDTMKILCDDPGVVQRIVNGENVREFSKTSLAGDYVNGFCSFTKDQCNKFNNWPAIKNNVDYEAEKAQGIVSTITDRPNVKYVEYKLNKGSDGLYDGTGVCVLENPNLRAYCDTIGIKYNETEGRCIIDEVYCKKMVGTWALNSNTGKYDCGLSDAQIAAEVFGGTVTTRESAASGDYDRLEKCGPGETDYGSACIWCPNEYPKMDAGLCYTATGEGAKCMEGYKLVGALCYPETVCDSSKGYQDMGLYCTLPMYVQPVGKIPSSKCSNPDMRNDGLICWNTPKSNGCNTCTGCGCIKQGVSSTCPDGLSNIGGQCWGVKKPDGTYINYGKSGLPCGQYGCDSIQMQSTKTCPEGMRNDGVNCWDDVRCTAACGIAENSQLFCDTGYHSCDGMCYPDCQEGYSTGPGKCTTCRANCPEGTNDTGTTCTKTVLPANGLMPNSRRRRHITGIGVGGGPLNMGAFLEPQKAEMVCEEAPVELLDQSLQGICWRKSECRQGLNKINGECWDTYYYNEQKCTCNSLKECTCGGISYNTWI